MELHERLGTARRQTPSSRDLFDELKNQIHMQVIGELGPQLYNATMDQTAIRERVVAEVKGKLALETGISRDERERLAGEITDDILGYGPLERLLTDDSITEIMVNGPGEIWIERQGRLYETTVRFTDDGHLRRIINRIVSQIGRRIDEASPMVDARLPDGSRVNAIIPPLSLSGPLLTIRKFSRKRLTLEDMIAISSLSPEAVEFLQHCIKAELNILISGGTGTGKTTLLNALSAGIPEADRIITIEDAAELQLQQRHVLRLESRPRNIEGEGEVEIRMLLRNSLRMRPDRIIVGEIRGAEAVDMLQAMNTGHDGSLSTVHANSPRDALHRVETMVLMAGIELPVKAIRQQAASALDLIVHLERMDDGSRKVTTITEVHGMESDVVTLQDLFAYKIESIAPDRTINGRLHATGLRPVFLHKFEKHGIQLPLELFRPGAALGSVAEGGDGVKRLVVIGTVAAAALAVGIGTAVSAEGAPSLTDTSARFPDRFYSLQLPERRLLTAADVSVTENGEPVANLSVTSPGGPGSVAVLVIDASNSMKGAPIADAMRAARAFAARRNAGTELGVVLFNNDVTVALPPTRDRAAIAAALASPPDLAEGTKIYDALGVAASQLEETGASAGSVVLLTDGDDVGSIATEEVALSRLLAENARVFAVGLRSEAYTPETLQTLAGDTGGTYAEVAGSEGLAPVFDALGFRLSKEYLVFYRSLAKPEQKVNVVIRVAGYDQALRTSYTTPALNLADGTVSKSFWDRLVQSWAFMILVAAAILGLLVYGARKVLSARRGPLRGRIAQYVDPDVQRLQETDDVFDRIESVGRRLERKGPMQRFSEMCDVGGVEMRPSVLAVGALVGGLLLAVLLAVIVGPWAFVLGALVPLGTWVYVRRKMHTRRKRFGEQLPEDLDVLAAALRAGHSLAGGFAVMAEQAAEPSRAEFHRVVTDEQLGVQLDEALDRVGTRMENRDMDQVALIALLARETGGSSAEVIDQVSTNIRARMDVRRLVHTLTAQGRLARWIVSFMPVFLVLAIYVIFPTYLNPLFNTTVGLVMFVVAALMVIAGSLVIKRIVEIKV